MSFLTSPISFVGVDSCWQWVMFLCAEKLTASMTYAFMIALLAYAILTLKKRNHLPQTPVFIAAFSWMVVLSTLQIILDLADFVTGMESMNRRFQANFVALCEENPWRSATSILYNAQWALLAANVLVADGIFVFRAYLIWNHNVRVIIVPILLLIATVVTTAVVPTGRVDIRIALGLGMTTNLLLLGLVVGRMIWSARTLAHTFGIVSAKKRMKGVMTVILQSGILYTTTALAVLISGSIGEANNLVFFISIGAARHVVNIVPVLVIVKSALSREAGEDLIEVGGDRVV
ncbi:hypothetical protein C8R46DRAFT_1102348 [Mycena filopes]|nr:hypothetical protein C8R46DRAFT_1102348 [Mycena filopes]